MNFINTYPPLTQAELAAAEAELGFSLPRCVREHYLRWNGGQPQPDYYGEPAYTLVHGVLSLQPSTEKGSAIRSYGRLVSEKQLMPPRWLPFAYDPGGDYFFVNCSIDIGEVIFFKGDYWPDEMDRCIVKLGVGFEEFWNRLCDDPDNL